MITREERILLLETMPAYGNGEDDRPLFDLANDIILDAEETLERRGRAMAAIDKAMGEEPLDVSDEAAVQEALADYLSMVSSPQGTI